MNDQKQQLVEKLKTASNILVTVRNNPTVDLLSACIGLTILLNKLDKHATAVFSGEVPSTIEFLKPDETLEKNTDSLRDFIIALDKSKADKLRYKVEDKTVRIFITPFRTSLSQDDLEFSQGDFNVDVVLALGAHEQHELDQAITEHGRILHDAVVVSVNNVEAGNLGTINWLDTSASSISEMVADLSKDLGKDLLDEQIATALLTGIVAETERFSNERTTPEVMTISSELMAAGANQQLVATKLDAAVEADLRPASEGEKPAEAQPEAPKSDDGTLEIDHEDSKPAEQSSAPSENNPPEEHHEKVIEPPTEPEAQSFTEMASRALDESNNLTLPPKEENEPPKITSLHGSEELLPNVPEAPSSEVRDMTGVNFAAEQPSGQSPLTANIRPEPLGGPLDPLAAQTGSHPPLLSHDHESNDAPEKPAEPTPEPTAPVVSPLGDPTVTEQKPAETPQDAPASVTPTPDATASKTLSELEAEVHSPHLNGEVEAKPDLDSARDEVLKALQETPAQPEPLAALNAQPVDLNKQPEAPQPPAAEPSAELTVDAEGNLQLPQLPSQPTNEPAPNPMSPADRPMDMPLPPSINLPPPQSAPPTNTPNQKPDAPPPVPPPMLPPM